MQKPYLRWISALLCVLFLVMTCISCSAETVNSEKLKVVATIFPQYDFLRAIAGDKIELSMLLKPGAEIHSYEPSPQDVISIQKSDLFVFVGGESDAWVRTILESAPSDTRKDIALIELVEASEDQTHEHDDEHEHKYTHGENHEHEYDEHVWTSPVNAMTIVSALTDALCELDAANADVYRANAESYLEKLSALDEAFRSVVSEGKRTHVVFGDRFPLAYFVEEYGLTYTAAFDSCSGEAEPSPAHLLHIIETMKKEDIKAVYYEELSTPKTAFLIAEETGASALLLHSCHTLSKDEAGETYLTLMQKNLENLKIGLE